MCDLTLMSQLSSLQTNGCLLETPGALLASLSLLWAEQFQAPQSNL